MFDTQKCCPYRASPNTDAPYKCGRDQCILICQYRGGFDRDLHQRMDGLQGQPIMEFTTHGENTLHHKLNHQIDDHHKWARLLANVFECGPFRNHDLSSAVNNRQHGELVANQRGHQQQIPRSLPTGTWITDPGQNFLWAPCTTTVQDKKAGGSLATAQPHTLEARTDHHRQGTDLRAAGIPKHLSQTRAPPTEP